MEDFENVPVSVDPGDLSEVLQSAEAWASHLRVRGGVVTAEAAADRIDAAIHRLREQTYQGLATSLKSS